MKNVYGIIRRIDRSFAGEISWFLQNSFIRPVQ